MYLIKLLFFGSFLAGVFNVAHADFGLTDCKQIWDSFFVIEKSAGGHSEEVAIADIYVELEIGRKRGENRHGEPCACPGACLGICSVRVGISRGLSTSGISGFLDVDDRLNVARIYFVDEVDFTRPELLIDEDLLIDFKDQIGGSLDGVILEKGLYNAVAHKGSVRIDNTASRYKGYVDVNVRRF
jgi:hypothetical protein